MMNIPIEDFLDSLKGGYTEYKECVANGSDEIDLAHIKGFCTTIEQILNVYGNVTSQEIKQIKQSIIGNISLARKTKNISICQEIDLDEPTILRRLKDNRSGNV